MLNNKPMKTNVLLLLLVSTLISETISQPQPFNYEFLQNDYHLVHDRLELVRFNQKFVSQYSSKNFKYNRTTKAVNLTFAFNVDLGNDLEVVSQAYKFMSNEFRYFPMRLGVNYCKGLSTNILGAGGFMKCGNFTGCPLIKGKVYHICNWVPDEKKLPPFVPSGSYMIEFQALYFDEEVYVLRGYASIIRSEV